MHWFKWNIQIMWYPKSCDLDSIIRKCDFFQEGLFSTFWISEIWLQFVIRQGVPGNRFNVCEELTFSRTFRKNSTERNKQDIKSQLSDISITNQFYSFHIKDQGIVQMKLMQLLQPRGKRPKIKWMKAIMTKMKQDRRYLKMKTPGCCAFQQQFLGPPSPSPLFCC